jgi:indole-3-glycerol phosphate synthase
VNILQQIFLEKREQVRVITGSQLREMAARALDSDPPRGFKQALLASQNPLPLIAEVKRASPVKGIIRTNFDPVDLAKTYAQAGADCLSVLTDENHFQGSESDFRSVREAVPLPMLRKDFTAGAYHVYEARAMGADCVLLIVACLSDDELKSLSDLTHSLGMDTLVEAHSEEEAEKGLACEPDLLGINNRDLMTFTTTVDIGLRVLPLFRGKGFLVTESAIETNGHVKSLQEAGAQAALIGTAFCQSSDVAGAMREVMGWSESRSVV